VISIIIFEFRLMLFDCRLVAALARDLQQHFYPVFYRIVDVLLRLLDANDPGEYADCCLR
jgi:hypothetical protein